MDNPYYDQPVVCISHNDLDGLASAAVVKKKYPDARIFHTNYGKYIPNQAFVPGTKLFITDFSLEEPEFRRAEHIVGKQNIVWIDHHEAAIRDMEAKGFSYQGIRSPDRCGAYLCWKFLFPNKPVPKVIELVDDYDRWVFSDPRTKAFNAGSGIFDLRPSSKSAVPIWDDLLNDHTGVAEARLKILVSIGEKVMNYNESKHKMLCEDLVYPCELHGKKFLIANTKMSNSSFFDSVDKTGYDGLGVVQYAPDIGKYRCSLYSPDDVKETLPFVREYFNGGGHPKACGFQAQTYPFPLPPLQTPPDLGKVAEKYAAFFKQRRECPLINQFASKGDKISLMSGGARAQIGNTPCIAFNHPMVHELLDPFASIVDIVDQATGNPITSVVGYCMTKYGYWRCEWVSLKETHGAFAGAKSWVASNFEGSIVGPIQRYRDLDVLWFYTKSLPVQIIL